MCAIDVVSFAHACKARLATTMFTSQTLDITFPSHDAGFCGANQRYCTTHDTITLEGGLRFAYDAETFLPAALSPCGRNSHWIYRRYFGKFLEKVGKKVTGTSYETRDGDLQEKPTRAADGVSFALTRRPDLAVGFELAGPRQPTSGQSKSSAL